jgi:hypothetical protein
MASGDIEFEAWGAQVVLNASQKTKLATFLSGMVEFAVADLTEISIVKHNGDVYLTPKGLKQLSPTAFANEIISGNVLRVVRKVP